MLSLGLGQGLGLVLGLELVIWLGLGLNYTALRLWLVVVLLRLGLGADTQIWVISIKRAIFFLMFSAWYKKKGYIPQQTTIEITNVSGIDVLPHISTFIFSFPQTN